MVRLHRLRLLANFIVKGADQKSASTSSIAKLPVHKVGAVAGLGCLGQGAGGWVVDSATVAAPALAQPQR